MTALGRKYEHTGRTHVAPSPRGTGFGVFLLAVILLIVGVTAWGAFLSGLFTAMARAL